MFATTDRQPEVGAEVLIQLKQPTSDQCSELVFQSQKTIVWKNVSLHHVTVCVLIFDNYS